MEHHDESWTVRLRSRLVCADLTFIFPTNLADFISDVTKTHTLLLAQWFRNSSVEPSISDHMSGLGGRRREVSLIAIWMTEEAVDSLVRWSLIISDDRSGRFHLDINHCLSVCLSVCLSLSLRIKVRIFCHLKDPTVHWTAECLLKKARVSMNHLWFQNLPSQRTQTN